MTESTSASAGLADLVGLGACDRIERASGRVAPPFQSDWSTPILVTIP